tara:strand:- start:413 stop:529 length:117 start_codon:yes stop_codon:yes gene_type:complete
MKHKRKFRRKAGRPKISAGKQREPIKLKKFVVPFGGRK